MDNEYKNNQQSYNAENNLNTDRFGFSQDSGASDNQIKSNMKDHNNHINSNHQNHMSNNMDESGNIASDSRKEPYMDSKKQEYSVDDYTNSGNNSYESASTVNPISEASGNVYSGTVNSGNENNSHEYSSGMGNPMNSFSYNTNSMERASSSGYSSFRNTDDDISNKMQNTDYQSNQSSSFMKAEQTENGEKPPKKRRKGMKLVKFTAAAVIFGLIAGVVFEGYYMINRPEVTVEDNKSGLIAEVTKVANEDENPISTGTSSGAIITDVSDVVNNVMPAIVAINSTASVTNYDIFGRRYTEEQEGSGSGIIIGQNNSKLLIVTNNHVVEDATTVEIVFADESKAIAEIKGTDKKSDLAVVAVDMKDITEETASAIKIATLGDSAKMEPGDMAIAIGNALGYGQSVTVGYISAVDREVTIDDKTMTLIQTDAAINPGNSGGALLNTYGQVIGINTVKFTQASSVSVEGMGYAIPISSAIPMINELMNRELVADGEQGFLGIDANTAQNVTELYAQRFNMPIGVYVNDVIEGSPADEAGLEQGNIITGLDGNTIETIEDLKNVLSYKKAGQKVKLIIQVRENGAYTEKTLEVTLGKRN